MNANRQIFFDTETTGLDSKVDRVCQLACVEVINDQPTGRILNLKFNPDREVEEKASEVNGLTWEMLKGEPRFREKVEEIVAFIEGAEMVAHNSGFDEGMIQAELSRVNYPRTIWEIAGKFIDTEALARRVLSKEKGKGKPLRNFKLDGVLDFFGIDRTARDKHDALQDCELLIPVYRGLAARVDMSRPSLESDVQRAPVAYIERSSDAALPRVQVSAAEIEANQGYLEALAKKEKVEPVAFQTRAAAPRP